MGQHWRFTGHPLVANHTDREGAKLSAELVDDDLSELVRNAVNVMDGEDLTHYVRWNFRNLLAALDPGDVEPAEYMALNVVLAKAMSRKLGAADSTQAAAVVGVLTDSRLRLVPPMRQPRSETAAGDSG